MAGSSRYTRGVGFFQKLKAISSFALGTSDVEETTLVANVSLTSANILAMNGSPVTVLAAPGTGKVILVDSLIFKMVTTATAYASGGTVSFQYNGGSVNPCSSTITAGTITAGAGTSYTELGPAIVASGAVLVANKAIEITNATGAFTTGTGTATIHIRYRVVTLP
jgi:hypothetical protein